MKLIHSSMLAAAFLAAAFLTPSCQSPPPPGYEEEALTLGRRDCLYIKLLNLLPEEQRKLPEAQAEAFWLADTGFKAAAALGRFNDPVWICWMNNRLVNSSIRERGLCWHYENDMYRELRRRKLSFYRIGCCVRDQGEGSEHNCVYVTGKDMEWPHMVIFDAWKWNGRLKFMDEEETVRHAWKDDPGTTETLSVIYPECHAYPFEHWARVKSGRKWNDYVGSWTPEGKASKQGKLMQENIERGLKERNGKLTPF